MDKIFNNSNSSVSNTLISTKSALPNQINHQSPISTVALSALENGESKKSTNPHGAITHNFTAIAVPNAAKKSDVPLQAAITQQTTKLYASIQPCLEMALEGRVNIAKAEEFADSLKAACEALRENTKGLPGKEAEEAFCKKTVQDIIQQTLSVQKTVLTSPGLSAKAQGAKLANLAYLSQALIAFATVQFTFGGKLAFHCLLHTKEMAIATAQNYEGTPYQLVAFCAAANHDSVMTYQDPPGLLSPDAKKREAALAANISFSNDLIRAENALQSDKAKTTNTLHVSLAKAHGAFLSMQYEQKRLAGFDKGKSEYLSFLQMEAQLAKLTRTMRIAEGMSRRVTASFTMHMKRGVAQLTKEIKSAIDLKKFREKSIRNTIPDISNYAPKGFGAKFFGIGNGATILPFISTLRAALKGPDAAAVKRYIEVMDATLTSLKKQEEKKEGFEYPSTLQQAIEDMNDAEQFYKLVAAKEKEMGQELEQALKEAVAKREDGITEAQIKEKIRDQLVKEPIRQRMLAEKTEKFASQSRPVPAKVPRFEVDPSREGDISIFLAIMPAFADPFLALKDIPEADFIAAFVEQLKRDQTRHANATPHAVLSWMRERVIASGTGNSDLNAFARAQGKNVRKWACSESIRIVVEQANPYQFAQFCSVHEKLVRHGYADGIANSQNEEIHMKLMESTFRDAYGITDEEYLGMQQFKVGMFQTIVGMGGQKDFGNNRLRILQNYSYVPMQALQQLLPDDRDLQTIVQNFEKIHLDSTGKINRESIDYVDSFARETQTAAGLCGSVMTYMAEAFGKHFLQAPTAYGFTDASGVQKSFAERQLDPLAIMK